MQRAVLSYRLAVHDVARDLEAQGHELLLSVDRHGLAGLPTSASTANVSAVDSDGLACTITVSSGYGAGITIPGTGMILNNALGEPELNRLGLHQLAPGTRLASNMAPTTGRTTDGRVLTRSAPRVLIGSRPPLMQVLVQGCLRDADLQSAIEAPRVHVSFAPDGTARVEHERPGDRTRRALPRAGEHRPRPDVDVLRGVGAAYRAADGRLEAAGDPRRAAEVALLP